MESPEYLICLDCETPCYDFEFKSGRVIEVTCATCGNEDPEQFLTDAQYEELFN